MLCARLNVNHVTMNHSHVSKWRVLIGWSVILGARQNLCSFPCLHAVIDTFVYRLLLITDGLSTDLLCDILPSDQISPTDYGRLISGLHGRRSHEPTFVVVFCRLSFNHDGGYSQMPVAWMVHVIAISDDKLQTCFLTFTRHGYHDPLRIRLTISFDIRPRICSLTAHQ